MSGMSPLARFLMSILSKGAWASGALLLVFATILLWQRWTPQGLVLQKGDLGFLAILAALFLLALYLVRGIKKEMDNPGG
jgi:hypothetical protein